jgi:hypothetical protein
MPACFRHLGHTFGRPPRLVPGSGRSINMFPNLIDADPSGSDVDALRLTHRAAMTIGRFVAERALTGQTPEGLDDYDAWLVEAKRNAVARIPARGMRRTWA